MADIREIISMEYSPISASKSELLNQGYTNYSFDELSILGASFAEMAGSFKAVAETVSAKGETLLRMTNGSISELTKAAEGNGLLRGFCSDDTIVKHGLFEKVETVSKEIDLNVNLDPAAMCVAIALMNISHKLSEIQKNQEKLLNRLDIKDRAELQGNVNYLLEILDNYKYCYNDEKQLNIYSGAIALVKKDAHSKIQFYQQLLSEEINKKSFLHSGLDLNKILTEKLRDFEHFQLAEYQYAFASFMEALTGGINDAERLENIKKWIREYVYQYKEVYTQCYEMLKDYAETSVEAKALGGLAKLSEKAGGLLANTKLADTIHIDAGFDKLSEGLDKASQKTAIEALAKLKELQDCQVAPFIEKIDSIKALVTNPISVLIDSKGLYIKAIA